MFLFRITDNAVQPQSNAIMYSIFFLLSSFDLNNACRTTTPNICMQKHIIEQERQHFGAKLATIANNINT